MVRQILYVFPNAKKAGAEQLTSLMMQAHDRNRYQPHAYFFGHGPFADELRERGVPVHIGSLPRRPRLRNPLSVVIQMKDIQRVIRKEEISLVHSVMGYGHLFGGVAAKLARTPEVWFQHGPTGRMDWLTGRVPSKTVFVNSSHTEREERSYLPWVDRIQLLYPGLPEFPADAYIAEAKKWRARVGIDEQEIAIGIAARIAPMKGHLLLAQAFKRVLDAGIRARLVFIGSSYSGGDQPYVRALEELIRKQEMRGKVLFTGFVDPVYPAIRAMDVLVNASVTPEPFGMTLIEAMMLERAVVAPDAGGPAEIVENGKDGLLFSSGNEESLAAELVKLAQDRALREKLGEAARRTVLERFRLERMVAELEGEYDRIFAEMNR